MCISPDAFEALVIRLLLSLGYGIRGEVTGRSGDAGIDGVVYEDRLGIFSNLCSSKTLDDPSGKAGSSAVLRCSHWPVRDQGCAHDNFYI